MVFLFSQLAQCEPQPAERMDLDTPIPSAFIIFPFQVTIYLTVKALKAIFLLKILMENTQ